ncbi:hypothetical protein GCM10027176_64280 [Actinoallomurus bryophytorum]
MAVAAAAAGVAQMGTYAPTGRAELVRLRRGLKDTRPAEAGRSQSRTGKA